MFGFVGVCHVRICCHYKHFEKLEYVLRSVVQIMLLSLKYETTNLEKRHIAVNSEDNLVPPNKQKIHVKIPAFQTLDPDVNDFHKLPVVARP